ncbi:MAG: hypothetical protein JXA07_13695 [Spirochaetes bacterium]|nr:hypothetical protein [Spirochaetota bacterium]
MISLDKINIEYKSTALFGLTALLLSFLVGSLAGISWYIVILRSLVLMAVFAAIGYGICVILRKFVPEVYGFLTSFPAAARTDREPGEETVIDVAGGEEPAYGGDEERTEAPASPDVAEGPHGEGFRELEKEGLAHYSTSPTGTNGGSGVHTPSGKLGKHIIEKEKLAKYEPKIMAQAVRTMMGKDRE